MTRLCCHHNGFMVARRQYGRRGLDLGQAGGVDLVRGGGGSGSSISACSRACSRWHEVSVVEMFRAGMMRAQAEPKDLVPL